MPQILATVTYLVRDYDEAIAYFRDQLGFNLLEDTRLDAEKRWVRVAPPGQTGTALLLARASTPEQRAVVGQQAGGRVFLFLQTSDFARDFAALRARNVNFLEAPRTEVYGTVAVFADLYGNKWDLLELKST